MKWSMWVANKKEWRRVSIHPTKLVLQFCLKYLFIFFRFSFKKIRFVFKMFSHYLYIIFFVRLRYVILLHNFSEHIFWFREFLGSGKNLTHFHHTIKYDIFVISLLVLLRTDGNKCAWLKKKTGISRF